MENHIHSIKVKYCQNTSSYILEKIKLCSQCREIPTVHYRSLTELENFYCKTCYEIKSFPFESTLLPSKEDLKFLENLKINCKYFEDGCSEVFLYKDFSMFSNHEKICIFPIKDLTLEEKCSISQKLKDSNFTKFEIDDLRILVLISDSLSLLSELNYLALYLGYNDLRHFAVDSLSDSLNKLAQLKYLILDLGYSNISSNGAKSFTDSLSNLKNLELLKLYFSNCKISENGAVCLSEAISNLTNLTCLNLNLYNNGITDNGAQILLNSLKRLSNLSYSIVDLRLNKISENFIKKIRRELNKDNFIIYFD